MSHAPACDSAINVKTDMPAPSTLEEFRAYFIALLWAMSDDELRAFFNETLLEVDGVRVVLK